MIVPTVRLRHRRTGRIMTVNATDYALNLAGWQNDWTRIGETHAPMDRETEDFEIRQAQWTFEKSRERDLPRLVAERSSAQDIRLPPDTVTGTAEAAVPEPAVAIEAAVEATVEPAPDPKPRRRRPR